MFQLLNCLKLKQTIDIDAFVYYANFLLRIFSISILVTHSLCIFHQCIIVELTSFYSSFTCSLGIQMLVMKWIQYNFPFPFINSILYLFPWKIFFFLNYLSIYFLLNFSFFHFYFLFNLFIYYFFLY